MKNKEWRRGWPAVFASAAGMGAGIGLYSVTAGLFVEPLEAEFGWSRAEIASVGILGLFTAFLLPFIGVIVDRFGARRVAAVGMICLSVGYVLMSNLSGTLLSYYLTMLFLFIVGPATGPVVFTGVVNSWFDEHRGLALGLSLSGVTVTSMIMLPVLAKVIEVSGWRSAMLVLASLPLVIGLPTVLGWLKNRNVPDNDVIDGDFANCKESSESDASLQEALRDKRFWFLGGGLFCANIAVGGVLSQLQPMLSGAGYSLSVAATLGSLFAISIAIGRLSSGLLLDRLWSPGVAFWFLLCPLPGLFILLSLEQPVFWIGAFAVFTFGVAQGAEIDFLAFLAHQYFGAKNYGKIFGVLATLVSISLVLGAIIFGLVYDKFGNYDVALYMSIAAYLFGACGVLMSGMVKAKVLSKGLLQ